MENKFIIIKRLIIALVIVLVILLLLVLSRVYYLVVINHVFEAIQKFKDEENREYCVEMKVNENTILKEQILLKQEIMKYINRKNSLDINCVWKNFKSKEKYSFGVKQKTVYINDLIMESKDILFNLPSLMGYTAENGKFDISKIFEVLYILPIKYQDKLCYKIITKNEVIIVEKDTYLPIYSSIKRMKSNEESKSVIERRYEFKVGEVTDEDVELPNLSEYTFVEN